MNQSKKVDVVIIGAGPIGLAMAVRLMNSNCSFRILEKGITVGSNMLQWGEVQLFTNWQQSVDPICIEFLKSKQAGISYNDTCPNGKEFVNQYLKEIANLSPIKDQLSLETEVTGLSYNEVDQEFIVEIENHGKKSVLKSRAVIDASGTWGNFNPITKDEDSYKEFITKGIVDRNANIKEFGRIGVIGNGHSAMNSILALSIFSMAEIFWIIRNGEPKIGKSKVGGQSDGLEKKIKNLIQLNKIQLITKFDIDKLERKNDCLDLYSVSEQKISGLDQIILNTGFTPDYSFIQDISLQLDRKFEVATSLSDKINPAMHSCDTVSYQFKDTLLSSVPYYVVGMKSFGKASNFLLSSGYEILNDLMKEINQLNDDCFKASAG